MLTGKKILMVIAPENFRCEELLAPQEIFEWQGAKVIIASKVTGEIKGMYGAVAEADIPLPEVEPGDYDAVVFVGGSGARQYWDDPAIHDLTRRFRDENKVIGAICIAPVILDRAGVLKGCKISIFHSAASEIKTARVMNDRVTVDGNIVTGNGPDSAEEFAGAIIDQLKI
ncbi:MAG: DJ-1/PfpI family protein [Bacillota bacterium]